MLYVVSYRPSNHREKTPTIKRPPVNEHLTTVEGTSIKSPNLFSSHITPQDPVNVTGTPQPENLWGHICLKMV